MQVILFLLRKIQLMSIMHIIADMIHDFNNIAATSCLSSIFCEHMADDHLLIYLPGPDIDSPYRFIYTLSIIMKG